MRKWRRLFDGVIHQKIPFTTEQIKLDARDQKAAAFEECRLIISCMCEGHQRTVTKRIHHTP